MSLVLSVLIFTRNTASNKVQRPFKNRTVGREDQSCVDLKIKAQTKANRGLLKLVLIFPDVLRERRGSWSETLILTSLTCVFIHKQ